MAKVSANIKQEHYKTEIRSLSGNVVISDEPIADGGKGLGFTPRELLVAALSACTSATLRMYADRKGWDLQELTVDTEITETESGSSLITRKLHLTGNLDEEQKQRLLAIANKCPVHKILSNPIQVETTLDQDYSAFKP